MGLVIKVKRITITLCLVMLTHTCMAADKTILYPFDLVLQKKEEDFFIGAGKPNPAEQKRLYEVREELKELLLQEGSYNILDLSPISKEIEAAAPLVDCNGCEIDFAKKLGAQTFFTGVIDKASDTLLNMRIAEVEVSSGLTKRSGSVVIQGNTDEAWLRGVRWLMKNRLKGEGAK
ncbi:MAG: DUF3280 domain-containing protein [Hyphomicrobium sp.]